jgi:uracil-DNA glycosylase
MTIRQVLVEQSRVHDSWKSILLDALDSVDGDYLDSLQASRLWLPGTDNLFSAFRSDAKDLKYILIGESPYPRQQSANGIAFYDGAVDSLWSENGLSKPVNRATSMRNLLKTMLVAEGLISPDEEGRISQSMIASLDKSNLVKSMPALFQNWQQAGFLMLNATPVLHNDRKPAQEAKYWFKFLVRLLEQVADTSDSKVTLLLWGKIAETIEPLAVASDYQKIVCEHPYNISFIHNPKMLELFGALHLLRANSRRDEAESQWIPSSVS